VFGRRGATLGDARFRSLLLLVLHNTVTDSLWPVSNCTRAKYNQADRNLNRPSDRNQPRLAAQHAGLRQHDRPLESAPSRSDDWEWRPERVLWG
jgi:hypothetical protein